MVQRHSIVLWKKAEKKEKNFEEISRETYDVLNLLQEYPYELRPNYLTCDSQKDIKEFQWNQENFSSALKRGINKEDENVFEDLGYSISFFSSFDEKESSSIQIQTGNKNDKFYDTLIINLPLKLDLYEKDNAEMVRKLFKNLVLAYKPYWGCLANRAISRKYGRYLEGNMPTTVHWMNYWSEDTVNTIGIEKLKKIMYEYNTVLFQDNILVVKEIAFDVDKDEDMIFHEKLHKQLFS
ncbi:hypothetical protein D6856_12600 [Butyrivibrio sp. XB500-5]|uniref:Imm52 family immunity protein n=1 Tax=Butyrivibrio sp. XB500-5 TaxID=2364880 RepID=UPI000EA97DBC|nr:Imm52 family immunity protein [Butyrivibrio sp. XB500-5]RKM58587.1 hypothetical protein D6856_12600 [Butyrivibrio sp. XB500-5]